MNPAPSYILDADVLITAKNQYYAFDLCPGFWDSLIHYHKKGYINSIDRVKNEPSCRCKNRKSGAMGKK